ncbi:MAG: hypothetical protein IPG78_15225 [Ignavibacteria bacterium]|jgi:hypothetical protein|nr:hypothetical protein [Ignavibacteria bacterium]
MAEEKKEVSKAIKIKVLEPTGWGIDGVHYNCGETIPKPGHAIEVDENFFQYLNKHGKFELVK